MKFSLLRPALALGMAMGLASCGGGGKATYPVKVTAYNLLYDGLVMTTNGQDVALSPSSTPAKGVSATFPQQIEYGTVYTVLVKTQPKHQTCTPLTSLKPDQTPPGPIQSTAGLLATIDVSYTCAINPYPVAGLIKGLTGTGLVLINGSNGGQFAATPVIDNSGVPSDITFGPVGQDLLSVGLYKVPYGSTYGVTVLTQPTGQTCTVTGGANGQGAGTIDEGVETAGGVSNIVVTCTKNS